jgi:PilZ domain-containing protein
VNRPAIRLSSRAEEGPLATKQDKNASDRRSSLRQALCVPFRLSTQGRSPQTIDGETIDVSESGLGVKFSSRAAGKVDALLESLVEDRLTVDIMLRLPEGSIRMNGQVVWWGLLGDDDNFSVRAGILLPQPWSDADWALIEKNFSN